MNHLTENHLECHVLVFFEVEFYFYPRSASHTIIQCTNYFSIASTFPSHGLSIKPAWQNPNLGRIQCGVYAQLMSTSGRKNGTLKISDMLATSRNVLSSESTCTPHHSAPISQTLSPHPHMFNKQSSIPHFNSLNFLPPDVLTSLYPTPRMLLKMQIPWFHSGHTDSKPLGGKSRMARSKQALETILMPMIQRHSMFNVKFNLPSEISHRAMSPCSLCTADRVWRYPSGERLQPIHVVT